MRLAHTFAVKHIRRQDSLQGLLADTLGLLRFPDAALAIFTALRSARFQHDVVLAAADATLSTKDKELLIAILTVYKQAEDARNELGHGIWGEVLSDTKAAIWLRPADYAILNVTSIRKPAKARDARYRDLEEKMFVYELSDLDAIRAQIGRADQNVFQFTQYLQRRSGRIRTEPEADVRYRLLASDTEIAQALANKGPATSPGKGRKSRK